MENQYSSQTSMLDDAIQDDTIPQRSGWLIPLLLFIIIALLGATGFFAYQYVQITIDDNQEHQIAANEDCLATFTSEYLQLTFDYNSCDWRMQESQVSTEPGVFSVITAQHISNHNISIKAENLGMGGGYPTCGQATNITFVENGIVRFQLIKSIDHSGKDAPDYYHYLTPKHHYAIQGHAGAFGEEAFKEYASLLNMKAFPNSNMCWRYGGTYSVAILQPTAEQSEPWQIQKDIAIVIEEETISDQSFFAAADELVVSVYEAIES